MLAALLLVCALSGCGSANSIKAYSAYAGLSYDNSYTMGGLYTEFYNSYDPGTLNGYIGYIEDSGFKLDESKDYATATIYTYKSGKNYIYITLGSSLQIGITDSMDIDRGSGGAFGVNNGTFDGNDSPDDGGSSKCSRCYGMGTCPKCYGSGQLSNPYVMGERLECTTCGGSGECPNCGGTGVD